MTRTEESAVSTHPSPTVLLACELSERTWKLGFATGLGQRSRVRSIAADTVDRLVEDIARAKVRLHVPADTPVVSGYEAGRDGFWLHRYLVAHGITNHVVDSSSIEVNRRARRAKTDRLDLEGCSICWRGMCWATVACGGSSGCRRSPRKMRGSCTGRGKRYSRIGRG